MPLQVLAHVSPLMMITPYKRERKFKAQFWYTSFMISVMGHIFARGSTLAKENTRGSLVQVESCLGSISFFVYER
jgi:hypothetical protein